MYFTMRAFARAHELIGRRGIDQKEMIYVLFAMLYEGYGYAEALRAYAEYSGKRPDWIESRMDTASAMAGYRMTARQILEECYQEAIR